MSVELKQYQVEGMRQTVKTWISWRPTMHHTEQSLTNILTGELRELRVAKEQKRSIREITSEVGDVFFSTLAPDNGTGQFIPYYKAIFDYCDLSGIKPSRLFAETLDKNNANYPVYFFQRTSPFENPQDAISCLRVLRFNIGSIVGIKSAWREVEQIINKLPFMDAYDVTGQFRKFIKDKLTDILKGKKTNRFYR